MNLNDLADAYAYGSSEDPGLADPTCPACGEPLVEYADDRHGITSGLSPTTFCGSVWACPEHGTPEQVEARREFREPDVWLRTPGMAYTIQPGHILDGLLAAPIDAFTGLPDWTAATVVESPSQRAQWMERDIVRALRELADITDYFRQEF